MLAASDAYSALQAFLNNSRKLLVITGAGCSTASGIGDYRDDEGDWKRVQPVQHNDFMRSGYWRARYWARSQLGYPEFMRAEPNLSHQTLAAWEAAGRLVGLITQNVDGLHQKAGHRQVIDLHGRLDQVLCMSCRQKLPRQEIQTWLQTHNPNLKQEHYTLAPDGDADLVRERFDDIRVPTCQQCAGILKPDVVFFGDSVPRERVEAARRWVEAADALLIVGSSLMVYSSFRFVRQASQLGLPIAAINRGRTRADDLIHVKVTAECGATLAQLSL